MWPAAIRRRWLAFFTAVEHLSAYSSSADTVLMAPPTGYNGMTSSASCNIYRKPHNFVFCGYGGTNSGMWLTTHLFCIAQVVLLGISESTDHGVQACGQRRFDVDGLQFFTAVEHLSAYLSFDDTVLMAPPTGYNGMTSSASCNIYRKAHNFVFCGYGGTNSGMWLTTHLFCIAQVGAFTVSTVSIRSDVRGIVVLPCPQQCLGIMYDCFLVCKLLICGDVEENPGPTQKMFEELLEGQRAITKELTEIKALVTNNVKLINDLQNTIEIRSTLISSPASQDEQVQTTLKTFEHVVKFQAMKLTDLEDKNRRSNLIIHGLPESPEETEADLKEKVVSGIFKDTLSVSCGSIGRIHRLGRQRGKRPVIVYLQDFNEKKGNIQKCEETEGIFYIYSE
ncbi:uncharacterized protein LOC125945976 isoform X2 [Dermacentor silvarum]|uniref:uncharacterized protein LOC125945976 isoform X2 n=1 Tax=Dermacentor silvarum TaxID=543639 RepID=UPI002101890F|nr:uncharacterized protein LOC125945976 isoform X2 [Dermacentor silvarum]